MSSHALVSVPPSGRQRSDQPLRIWNLYRADHVVHANPALLLVGGRAVLSLEGSLLLDFLEANAADHDDDQQQHGAAGGQSDDQRVEAAGVRGWVLCGGSHICVCCCGLGAVADKKCMLRVICKKTF